MIWEDIVLEAIVQFFFSVVVFVVLGYVGKFLLNKIRTSPRLNESNLLNLDEYLPEEEFTTIKQVFYLIIIGIFIINILHIILDLHAYTFNRLLLDIIVSLYVVINEDIKFSEHKLLFILLIPIGSLSCMFFSNNYISFLDYVHIFAFPYLIRLYYRKFIEYTETNSLGITILLLFSIVFVSFFITMFVENQPPLEALVMVSNAFTSNGYSVLGASTYGKINALVLVWSGFILSGVGTATLAVAIIMRYADEKFDHLEELVRKNRKK